jgi:hypothetical protein
MIYLASPYSHTDRLIMKTRFLLAQQATAAMLSRREFVYSPIVHCHELTSQYSLPTDFDFWKAYNFDMLRRADKFVVLKIDGWEESKGVKAEAELAMLLDLPRGFIDAEGNEVL